MQAASVREAINLTNNSSFITPYTLRQVIQGYVTKKDLNKALADIVIDPSTIDLSGYAKKEDLPKDLGDLSNDADYVKAIDGLIPTKYLPSYVDDVLEYDSLEAFPNPGSTGKIYVDKTTNLTYRWGGSSYIEISKSLALGTTSETAFRGDLGAEAYAHISVTGNPHNLALSDLGISIDATTINYLNGLDKNIIVKFAEKLDLSGGTMTGYIILHHDPVEKMHAATKDYVDKEIQGISVTVEQNITRTEEISNAVDGATNRLDKIETETLVEVENKLTGLNQTTESHTEHFKNIEEDIDGISTELGQTKDSVTILEATVNLLEIDLNTTNLNISVNDSNKPAKDTRYTIGYETKFRGNIMEGPEEVSVIETYDGITVTTDNKNIYVDVLSSIAIPEELNIFTIVFKYTSGVVYTVTKHLWVATTKSSGATGANQIIESETAPTDTTKFWYDTKEELMKRYDEGTSTWIAINKYDTMNTYISNHEESINSMESNLKFNASLIASLNQTATNLDKLINGDWRYLLTTDSIYGNNNYYTFAYTTDTEYVASKQYYTYIDGQFVNYIAWSEGDIIVPNTVYERKELVAGIDYTVGATIPADTVYNYLCVNKTFASSLELQTDKQINDIFGTTKEDLNKLKEDVGDINKNIAILQETYSYVSRYCPNTKGIALIVRASGSTTSLVLLSDQVAFVADCAQAYCLAHWGESDPDYNGKPYTRLGYLTSNSLHIDHSTIAITLKLGLKDSDGNVKEYWQWATDPNTQNLELKWLGG